MSELAWSRPGQWERGPGQPILAGGRCVSTKWQGSTHTFMRCCQNLPGDGPAVAAAAN